MAGAPRPARTTTLIAVLALVAALHVALFWSLRGATVRFQGAAGDAPRRVTLRLLSAVVAPRPAADAPPPALPIAATRPIRSTPPMVATHPTRPSRAARAGADAFTPTLPRGATLPAADGDDDAPVRSASSAADAASAPLTGTSLLDNPATRRAIRASAATLSLGARANAAAGVAAAAGSDAQLAAAVKAAGRGDCLKGEFAGSGMGLLSAPFLAAAAARGKCAQ